MANPELVNEIKNKAQLTEEVDSIIKSVGQRIKNDSLEMGSYAGTVKALAELVTARASL